MSELGFPKVKRVENRALLDEIKTQPCVICGKSGPGVTIDPSHIRGVGAGGPDTDWNVFAFCREHHNSWHGIGVSRFLKRHPEFRKLLEANGWEIDDFKLRHKLLTKGAVMLGVMAAIVLYPVGILT